jgi:hypothetical protein
MKHLKHPATIIAAVALFVGLGGGAAAYASGLISGSQIRNHSIAETKLTKKAIKALHGKRGPHGPRGPQGATGPQGAVGPQGPSGVVATKAFAGPLPDEIPPEAFPYVFSWVFGGPTVIVSTAVTQHLVGAATAVLGSTSGTEFDFGLCYQNASGGAVRNFVGEDYLTAEATDLPLPYTASASVVPGAGTWKVGFCVVNQGSSSLDDNDFVNGWVQATN